LNKHALISALREKTDISKPEAASIVNLIFDNMANTLASGDRVEIGWRSGDYVAFMSRNTKAMLAGILKQGLKCQSNPRNCRFSRQAGN